MADVGIGELVAEARYDDHHRRVVAAVGGGVVSENNGTGGLGSQSRENMEKYFTTTAREEVHGQHDRHLRIGDRRSVNSMVDGESFEAGDEDALRRSAHGRAAFAGGGCHGASSKVGGVPWGTIGSTRIVRRGSLPYSQPWQRQGQQWR